MSENASTPSTAERAFTKAGLVRRIEPAGSPARFKTRVDDNHHHVVCRVCGATADVDCAVGAAPCLDPSNDQGFLIDESEVTHWGLCSTCQTSTHIGGQTGWISLCCTRTPPSPIPWARTSTTPPRSRPWTSPP